MSIVPQKSPRSKVALIGCAIGIVLLLLCAGAGVAIYYGARGAVEAVQEQERFAQQWTPPAAEAPPETFAPESVAGFTLESSDEQAEFPALGIEQAGFHAIYTKDGDTVDVSVYRMTEAEKTAVFDEIIRRIDDDDRFRSNSHVRLPRSLRFSVSPPELHGSLWHSQGWLVFVRSETTEDLEPFQRAYLEAIGGGN
ncbi:MAG: hypothetical protein M3552_14640 [Planctomycetota bacterium]|nr:hypothetical protein [Planctomycetaceae bacterium]MDQ3331868.1 hypothetical protein [Planctomycetota bacterium]